MSRRPATGVRARSEVTVRAGGVLGRMRCEPPLTVRRVHADQADICALCLIGTAAGPLPGDELELDLHLQAGARATLTATGAAIAQGRVDDQGQSISASLRMRACLDAGAELRADPGALIVCDGARVDVTVDIAIAADASVQWREVVVLGRSGDLAPGAVTIGWNVTRDGAPVLRQFLDLADHRLRSWPGMTGGARVIASVLHSGPRVSARTIVAAPGAVVQRIDDHTGLVTVLGADAAAVGALATQLLQQLDTPIGVRT